MDNQKVAKTLVRLARELVAARDIDYAVVFGHLTGTQRQISFHRSTGAGGYWTQELVDASFEGLENDAKKALQGVRASLGSKSVRSMRNAYLDFNKSRPEFTVWFRLADDVSTAEQVAEALKDTGLVPKVEIN